MKMRMTLENFGGRSTQYYTEFLIHQCLPRVISPHFTTVFPPFCKQDRTNKNEFCDPKHNVPHIPPPEINFPMTSFEPATVDEVKKLILSSQDKSCDLDPLPTKLLKSCLDILLTPITNIVNLSLESGSFLDVLKVSHITPLLKKPSLSKDDMNNYRPVSNLNLNSKIIEKIISNRIRTHLDKNNLSIPNQSAYKPLHSTETALLKIHNDICISMDSGKTTALVLLDLSAAFDTLDGWYGISGTALNWVRSYLSNRVQRVKLLDKLGGPFKTDYGVPQGSLLGPLLFTLYTTPLRSVIVSITSATICTLMTHRFIFLFLKQRCHCRWSSSACKTSPTV